MDATFRILRIETSDGSVEARWRENIDVNHRLVFSDYQNGGAVDHSQQITAVIGKNGTGKSNLLTSIIQLLLYLKDLKEGKKRRAPSFAISYIAYRLGESRCEVLLDSGRRPSIKVNDIELGISELPLPGRIIALTISPFDKFPVPRTLRHSVAAAETSIYRYLGLRDHFNKASIETLLFRSLNNLFEEGENEALRRINIGAVFAYLGLNPILTVVYRLRISTRMRHELLNQSKINFRNGFSDSTQQRRVNETLSAGMSEENLEELLSYAVSREIKGLVRTSADFSLGGQVDEAFKELQPLRRTGLLRLSGVEIADFNGRVSDLRKSSSGQLSMVSALLALASVITNGSLVLIDEPELSLHPEWQVNYVNLLLKTFARFNGCHFVIATHSPMVIAELPSNSKIIALDRLDLPPAKELIGQSSDYLLAEAFGSATPGNLYVRERIVRALRLVAEGKAKSDEFDLVIGDLVKLREDLVNEDPAREMIENLMGVAEQAGTRVV